MPDARPAESPENNRGLGSAILLSLGLHTLVALWFWHGLAGTVNEGSNAIQIIDTRVENPGIEVEVSLKLLDPSKPPSKKKVLQSAASSPQPLPARKTVVDSPKPSGLVGAELCKPQSQRSAVPVALSKSQPSTLPPRFPMATSEEKGSMGGSSRSSEDEAVGHGGTIHISARAKSVVYVIDRSVSMGLSGGLARAKRELLTRLQRMPNQTQFQIIIFNRSFEVLSAGSAGLLAATNDNKRKAAEFLAPIQPEGGTLPVPALKRALAWKPDVIFFLSDGGDWTVPLVREILSVNRGRSVIHVVDFGGRIHDQPNGPLRLLAGKNHGQYRAILAEEESWQMRGN